MKEIQARWDPLTQEVRASLPARFVVAMSRQDTEQLIEALRVALIDSEEPLPEFSPVKL